jgi:hypothetical protein
VKRGKIVVLGNPNKGESQRQPGWRAVWHKFSLFIRAEEVSAGEETSRAA